MVKCFSCNKKLSLMEESMGNCKCEKYYCILHKLPEDHTCTYNFKKEQQEKLEQEMKRVQASKITSI
jgi:predicted nucleic acid binding AN1-type Zn finger protein